MDLVSLEIFNLAQLQLVLQCFPYLCADGRCAQLIEERKRENEIARQQELEVLERTRKGKMEAPESSSSVDNQQQDDATQHWRKQSQRTKATQQLIRMLCVCV
jgi:C4-dicarboxylate-specific signal transduction histidine kinase